jgi:hypothetical protein
MVTNSDKTIDGAVRVRRGRVDSVDLYEIKDSELDLLEKGSPSDLHLNFAIFLLSIAFSAICALATATFSSETIKTSFIVVTVVGILVGAYLFIAWFRDRQDRKELCKVIRGRIPPDIAPPPPSEAPDEAGEGGVERPAG